MMPPENLVSVTFEGFDGSAMDVRLGATLQDGDTGRIAIYYGAADTNVGLAFTTVDEVVSYIKEHSVLHYADDEGVHNY